MKQNASNKVIEKNVTTVTNESKKANLISLLDTFNKERATNQTVKNKYNYPKDYEGLKSTSKEKKSYRHAIQKNILSYLSISEPTKDDKERFNSLCKAFINGFNSIDKCTIESVYSFAESNAKEKENAKNILIKYKAIK